jgi:hypothetical protein
MSNNIPRDQFDHTDRLPVKHPDAGTVSPMTGAYLLDEDVLPPWPEWRTDPRFKDQNFLDLLHILKNDETSGNFKNQGLDDRAIDSLALSWDKRIEGYDTGIPTKYLYMGGPGRASYTNYDRKADEIRMYSENPTSDYVEEVAHGIWYNEIMQEDADIWRTSKEKNEIGEDVYGSRKVPGFEGELQFPVRAEKKDDHDHLHDWDWHAFSPAEITNALLKARDEGFDLTTIEALTHRPGGISDNLWQDVSLSKRNNKTSFNLTPNNTKIDNTDVNKAKIPINDLSQDATYVQKFDVDDLMTSTGLLKHLKSPVNEFQSLLKRLKEG